MSEKTVIECNKYKFIRYPNISGFIVFDKGTDSVGFDEVSAYIDNLEEENVKMREEINRALTRIGTNFNPDCIKEDLKRALEKGD